MNETEYSEEENKKIDEENKKIDEYNHKVEKYNKMLENGGNPDDDFEQEFDLNNNSEIPSKDEIIKNMAKHLQTNMEDGEEVLLRTYELAFIKGKMEAIKEMKKEN